MRDKKRILKRTHPLKCDAVRKQINLSYRHTTIQRRLRALLKGKRAARSPCSEGKSAPGERSRMQFF